jgi:DNA repair exonuclease SbcCD ATPase subunit
MANIRAAYVQFGQESDRRTEEILSASSASPAMQQALSELRDKRFNLLATAIAEREIAIVSRRAHPASSKAQAAVEGLFKKLDEDARSLAASTERLETSDLGIAPKASFDEYRRALKEFDDMDAAMAQAYEDRFRLMSIDKRLEAASPQAQTKFESLEKEREALYKSFEAAPSGSKRSAALEEKLEKVDAQMLSLLPIPQKQLDENERQLETLDQRGQELEKKLHALATGPLKIWLDVVRLQKKASYFWERGARSLTLDSD